MGLERNKTTDIRPALTTQAIAEGRMVVITTHSQDHNFGSWTDLVGIKLPANSTEAARARFVASFAVEVRPVPIYQNWPSIPQGSRRGGWSAPENVPFSAIVHMTPPGNKMFGVIPANTPALAFGQGEFTVYSGGFVPSASLVPGAYLEALNTADDGATEAGKLNYVANSTGAVAEVVHYDANKLELTFRTFNP